MLGYQWDRTLIYSDAMVGGELQGMSHVTSAKQAWKQIALDVKEMEEEV